MKVLGLILTSLLVACTAFADINDDYNALKDSGTNFTVIGVICEQVARLEMYEKYPAPAYDIYTGVEYSDGKRTIGELDVVVIDHNTKKAVEVGEVKCWRDLGAAHKKAMNQRGRFLKYINSDTVLRFRSTSNEGSFSQEQFEGISNFISISQKGGEAAGFTETLDYSLEELMGLREQIIGCQKARQCAAPTH